MKVFVLLFNPGTENEGIHTLSMGDRHLVLMFEDEDDATRYSLLLIIVTGKQIGRAHV